MYIHLGKVLASKFLPTELRARPLRLANAALPCHPFCGPRITRTCGCSRSISRPTVCGKGFHFCQFANLYLGAAGKLSCPCFQDPGCRVLQSMLLGRTGDITDGSCPKHKLRHDILPPCSVQNPPPAQYGHSQNG